MSNRIVIIQGHPDPGGKCFCHALEDSYVKGAMEGGHEVKQISTSQLDLPILRTKEEFANKNVPPAIQDCQENIRWAEHLVIIYPLWLGTMPALLKGFFEQVFRYGFAISSGDGDKMPKGLLTGRTSRIIITMGMPALIYRWFFGAHSLKSLERNILKLSGISPIKESLIGCVDSKDNEYRQKWIEDIYALGKKGK